MWIKFKIKIFRLMLMLINYFINLINQTRRYSSKILYPPFSLGHRRWPVRSRHSGPRGRGHLGEVSVSLAGNTVCIQVDWVWQDCSRNRSKSRKLLALVRRTPLWTSLRSLPIPTHKTCTPSDWSRRQLRSDSSQASPGTLGCPPSRRIGCLEHHPSLYSNA